MAIQPAWAVGKLVKRERVQIRDWLLDWPDSLGHGIVFIFTGRRNPWKKHLELRAQNHQVGSQSHEKPKDLLLGDSSRYRGAGEGDIRVNIPGVSNSRDGEGSRIRNDGSLTTSNFAPPGLTVSLPPQSYNMHQRRVYRHESQELFSPPASAYQPPGFDGSHPYARYGQDMV